MDWASICARRLARHALTTPAATVADIAATAGVVCGIHAQMPAAADVSLAIRVTGATSTDVAAALWQRRELVKTYGPRGTVHLFPATDAPIWSAALAEVRAGLPSLPPAAQMTDDQIEMVVRAIGDSLADGASLTVAELGAEVVARTGAWAGDEVMPAFAGMWPRWRSTIALAAYRGLLCFGENRGRRTTYAKPAAWRQIAGSEALDEAVRRYLFAYGPATPAHFAQWFGMPRPAATPIFERLAGELRDVTVDGVPAADLADGGGEVEPMRGVRLLPYFDAYTVGCHPRALVFPGSARDRALGHGQAGTVPVLLIDGALAGVWHQRRSGRAIAVTVEAFVPLTPRTRADLNDQVERLGEILGSRTDLTVGPVTAGHHL